MRRRAPRDGRADEPTPSIEVRDLSIDRRRAAAAGRRVVRLPAGATLAIVGRTGAGKTTLVDAVLRMQEVPPGAVRVGGRDVTHIPLAELRGLIGYAPQDAFLFSATVADNIALRHPRRRGRGRARRAGAARRRGGRPGARRGGAARRLRHAGRRARHHAVGRPAPAGGAGARAGRRPADPDPRRLAVVGRRRDRARHPDAAAADPGGPDVDPDLAPRGGGQGRRPDPGAGRRPRRRIRHARGAAGVGRRLRVALPRAARARRAA